MEDKPISRQRKWQLKKKAEGLCIQCGLPRDKDSKSLCPDCKEKCRVRQEAVRRAMGMSVWQQGKPGRPPKK